MSRIPKTFLIAVFFGLTIILLSSFTFLLLFLSIFLTNEVQENIDSSPSSVLLYQEFSSLDFSSTSGFVEVNQELSDDDFISYFNPNSESSVIVSNFADSRFECSGTCFCSDSQRKSSQTLTRSLSILFSALTSSLALNIATKSFQDQCSHQLFEICDEQNIQSQVFSCSETQDEEDEDGSDFAEYSCHGHCLPKILRSEATIQFQKEFFENEGKCEDLKISGEVKVKRKSENMKQSIVLSSTGKKRTYPARYTSMSRNARGAFRKAYLTQFCKEMSRRSVLRVYRRGKSKTVTNRESISFCVASRPDENKHIKCTLTSEKLTGKS